MFARAISSWGRLLGLGRSSEEAEEERRAFGRILCDLETVCQPTGREHGDRLTVRVKNASRGGTCLLAPRAYRPGELLSIGLPGSPPEVIAEVLACVVRCDPAGQHQWEVGCTFAQALPDEDLCRFGASRSQSSPPDKRSWVRFPCQARVAYQIVRTPEPTLWTPAAVVNISGGGIALQVEEILSVGDLLSVELRREGVAALTALASIVRTTVEHDGTRLIGCNFIHELPEAQVALLLQ